MEGRLFTTYNVRKQHLLLDKEISLGISLNKDHH